MVRLLIWDQEIARSNRVTPSDVKGMVSKYDWAKYMKDGIPVVNKVINADNEEYPVKMDEKGIYIPMADNMCGIFYMCIPIEVLEDAFRLIYKKLKSEILES